MPIKPWLISPQHTRVGAGGGGDLARDAGCVLWHALRVGDGRLCAASPITLTTPGACLRARAHLSTGRQHHVLHPPAPGNCFSGFLSTPLDPRRDAAAARAGHCHDRPSQHLRARTTKQWRCQGLTAARDARAQPHGICNHCTRHLCGRAALLRAPHACLKPCSSAALLQQHATWHQLRPRDGAFGVAAPVRCIVGRETARSGVRRCVRRALRWSGAAAL